ncbi:hypothetical protein K456DRAFT_98481 [Colletotrichum gloeosporioides 23]|nr:hypothetical protein K456DRAFT_98481 [Colletotrichum gloeosporioides 23]
MQGFEWLGWARDGRLQCRLPFAVLQSAGASSQSESTFFVFSFFSGRAKAKGPLHFLMFFSLFCLRLAGQGRYLGCLVLSYSKQIIGFLRQISEAISACPANPNASSPHFGLLPLPLSCHFDTVLFSAYVLCLSPRTGALPPPICARQQSLPSVVH